MFLILPILVIMTYIAIKLLYLTALMAGVLYLLKLFTQKEKHNDNQINDKE